MPRDSDGDVQPGIDLAEGLRETAARRRYRDHVFGTVLPDRTNEEQDPEDGSRSAEHRIDDELRRNVPPHHG